MTVLQRTVPALAACDTTRVFSAGRRVAGKTYVFSLGTNGLLCLVNETKKPAHFELECPAPARDFFSQSVLQGIGLGGSVTLVKPGDGIRSLWRLDHARQAQPDKVLDPVGRRVYNSDSQDVSDENSTPQRGDCP